MAYKRQKLDAVRNAKIVNALEDSIQTSRNKLQNLILFNLMEKTSMDLCFRCGQKIGSIEEMSIDHKIQWLNSNNPKELYYDLDNIAFSHSVCNSIANVDREGYVGISETKGKWMTRISHNGKSIYIGTYKTPEEAAIAYDEAAIKYRGVNTITNRKLGKLF